MDRKEFSKFIKKNQKWLASKIKLVQDGELTPKKIREEDIRVGDIFYNPETSYTQYVDRIYGLPHHTFQEVEFYEFLLNADGTATASKQELAEDDNFPKFSYSTNLFAYYKNLYKYVFLRNLANNHPNFINWQETPWKKSSSDQ